jgi:hypothetical protein
LFFVYNWFSDHRTVELVNDAVENMMTKHDQQMKHHNDSIQALTDNPDAYKHTFSLDADIRDELKNLLKETDADRVMLASFHNHEEGVQLRYLFYDEAYEVTNVDRHIPEVAQNYQKIRTSLTPFMNFLAEKTFYSGTYKSFRDIDLRYSHRMEEDGILFGSWRFLWSKSGRPIGVLSVSWYEKNRRYIPKKELIESKMAIYGELVMRLIDDNTPIHNRQ